MDSHRDLDRNADFVRAIPFYRRDNHPFADEWLERNLIPGGCVGVFARSMWQYGFDVTFSPVSSPNATPIKYSHALRSASLSLL